MKKTILFLFFLNTHFHLISGNDNFAIGARAAGMSNASVSLNDVWSAHHNQAGLSFVKKSSCGVYYENRFLLKELSLRAGVAALPVKGGTFGLSFSNFGYSLYNENKYSLSYAKAFGEKFSVGIAMDYLNTKIAEGYGSKGVAVAEIGLQTKPLKGLTIGAHVFNPTHTKLVNYNNERIPTIFRLGGNYNFSNKVILAIETEKDISQKAIFKTGIEYKPVNGFYLRAGLSTRPTLNSFGFGIQIKHLQIDLSSNYNQILGFSPQVGLTYIFNKN